KAILSLDRQFAQASADLHDTIPPTSSSSLTITGGQLKGLNHHVPILLPAPPATEIATIGNFRPAPVKNVRVNYSESDQISAYAQTYNHHPIKLRQDVHELQP